MSAIAERKALERLTRATRNLISGARLGGSQPPAEEDGAPAPEDAQAAEAAPEALETPPGQ